MNLAMPPSADRNQGIAGITFVEESLGAVLAVAGMTDLHVLVQEDEYITDSETDVDDDSPSGIMVSRACRATILIFGFICSWEYLDNDVWHMSMIF